MKDLKFNNETTQKIIEFIIGIGIEVSAAKLDEETIIPGIKIADGSLMVDEEKLTYPGDLLHEAGHLAVKPKTERETCGAHIGNDAAEEMMTLAWSWAALNHLNLDPKIVFHDGGYKGEADNIISNFSNGNVIGLPMLQWVGMCADSQRAPVMGVEPFPHMIKWLRE